eukprot:5360590-Heterocapsa_arctica.AAC.1
MASASTIVSVAHARSETTSTRYGQKTGPACAWKADIHKDVQDKAMTCTRHARRARQAVLLRVLLRVLL